MSWDGGGSSLDSRLDQVVAIHRAKTECVVLVVSPADGGARDRGSEREAGIGKERETSDRV